MPKKIEEEIVPSEIKDVVGYEFNGQIFPTRLAARKSKAELELHKLFPRDSYGPMSAYPRHSEITDKYEEVMKILSEIKD